jgi:hypothetical protein
MRPVPRQHRQTERVDFALANAGHAGPLKAQVKAADAGE